jgi:hypothetical protein
MVLATLVVLGFAIPIKILSDEDETLQFQLNPIESLSETPTPEEVKLALVFAAKKYGLDESQVLRTSWCESSFEYTAIGKAGEVGILQYMPSTWTYWNNERIKELGFMTRPLDIHSTKDQIEMLGWSWNKGYQSHWTCHRAL